ncbi:MAG TPA: hypothetical protein VNO22_05220 [Planctomycetota bacterium]|jgi:hypothetical protein|nr:hypothetical protein [Planctomycetota bacterium]
MGREIMYCWKCSQRLQTEDFEKGVAYRYQDKFSCSECVYDLVGDLSAEEQEAILNPKKPAGRTGTATRLAPVRPPSGGETTRRRTGPIPQATPASERRRGTTQIQRPAGATARQTRPIPRPSSSTRSISRAAAGEDVEGDLEPEEAAAETSPKKKKILIFAGAGGGGLLVLGVALVLLLSGGKKKGSGPSAAKGGETSPAAAPAPAPTPEQAAAQAMLDAVAYRKTNRDDWGGQYLRFKQVLEKGGADTRYADEARAEMERIARKVEERVFELNQQNQGLRVEELFSDLLAAWEKERDKYEAPELRAPFDRQLEGIRTTIKDRFNSLKEDALYQKRRGNEEGVSAARAKVAKWGLKEYAEELEKALAAAKPGEPAPAEARTAEAPADASAAPEAPAPKPLSPAMQKFLPRWQEAMGLAFGRDYDGASARLLKAVRDFAEEEEKERDEIKAEADFDQEALRAVRALVEETTGKMLPAMAKGGTVTLEYQHRPGEFRKVTGTVVQVYDQRAELEVVEKDKEKEKRTRCFVEFAHLSAASLAEHFTGPGGRTSEADRRAAALLCLIEGDVEAAKKFGGRAAGKIPERYWSFAKEAREKAPKPSAREFEARDLLHGAELDWRDVRSWGAAFDKYKLLKNEYAATAVVRRNQAVIVRRSEMGREYVFFPADLRVPTGSTFRLGRHPKMDPERIDQAWISKEDIDFTLARDNYVEAEFYALPGVSYRCWAYVGGCCAETFSVLYQTSEGTVPHPRDRSKTASLEPGGNFAAPVPHGISNLKKEHAAHAPKNSKEPHPKEPSRWEWIPIPLPKTYASPGPKSVRLLTDQGGFAVGYILISSTRTAVPTDAETKALAREYAEKPAGQRIVGQAEPVEWLVVGPFAGGIKDVQPPESALELDKELAGKDGGVRWKIADAFVRPQGAGKAAFFDLDQLFKPKDGVSAYLLIHVKSPLSMSAQLLLGYDDACKVWLNGSAVHTGESAKKADEVAVPVKLKEGWNRLLVKVSNKDKQWMLAIRLADKDKKPIDGLEYHPTGDELAR